MEATQPNPNSSLTHSPSGPLRPLFSDAIHFWEPRRLYYNIILASATLTWLAATWPHFRPALTLTSLLLLSVLALIANALYCAAYLVDLPMQLSTLRAAWQRHRWVLWLAGTLLALLLTNYWIADEIYPDFH